MHKQLRAYFSGTVQGVGFRYTAREIAEELGVRGWVKNLSDGKVEVCAEADEEALKDLLDKINRRFSDYIDNADTRWIAATGEFRDFRIIL